MNKNIKNWSSLLIIKNYFLKNKSARTSASDIRIKSLVNYSTSIVLSKGFQTQNSTSSALLKDSKKPIQFLHSGNRRFGLKLLENSLIPATFIKIHDHFDNQSHQENQGSKTTTRTTSLNFNDFLPYFGVITALFMFYNNENNNSNPVFKISQKNNLLNCAPTFNGVPVSATFLIQQALPIFSKKFPGLEMSPVFQINHPEYRYEETGLLSSVLWSDGVEVELPLFEKLSDVEEAKLGASGLRKSAVGCVILSGSCSLNCAQVKLAGIKVKKLGGGIVWEWSA